MDQVKSVIVIGGGLGGLLFAQLMRNKPDVKVTVYERDEHDTARSQGYQIGVNKDGRNALNKAKLEGLEDFFELNKFLDSFLIADENLTTLMRIRFKENDNSLVNRWKLRELLMKDIDIVWNKRFAKYEEFEDHVVAHFEDGTSAKADILIGSDGVKSKVRSQRTDKIVLEKLNVRNSSGFCKMPSREEVPLLYDGMSHSLVRIMAHGGYSALVIRFKSLSNEDYCVWAITNPVLEGDNSFSEDRAELKKIMSEKARAIHPEFQKLIDLTDLEDMIPIPNMHSAVSLTDQPLGKTTRVTLLGDSAHAMTSHRGLGANTAFQDAVDLAAAIQEPKWRPAVANYEKIMLKRGFSAVKQSKGATEQMTSTSATKASIAKWFMWIIGRFI